MPSRNLGNAGGAAACTPCADNEFSHSGATMCQKCQHGSVNADKSACIIEQQEQNGNNTYNQIEGHDNSGVVFDQTLTEGHYNNGTQSAQKEGHDDIEDQEFTEGHYRNGTQADQAPQEEGHDDPASDQTLTEGHLTRIALSLTVVIKENKRTRLKDTEIT